VLSVELAATHRYPAMLGISCGVTATDHPQLTACEDTYHTRPLAEQLLLGRSDAGASVIIGPTRNTYQYYDFLLGKHLLTRYYAGDHTWGEVFTRAMQAALAEDPSSYDRVYQYVLEGDPAALANAGGAVEVPSDPTRAAFGLPAPNPALRSTQLSYSVPRLTRVRLTICDVAGAGSARWWIAMSRMGPFPLALPFPPG
jgi:hypothetical protein